jgi:hypothetical protein
MEVVVNRFDVFLVNLNLTVGTEIQKTPPVQKAILDTVTEMFAE